VQRKPFQGVGDAFSAGVDGKDAVAAIMVGRGPNIPTRDAMGSPAFTDGWLLVDEELGAERAKWSPVEIKGSMKLCVCREVGVDP
jgi:hypothetical protein